MDAKTASDTLERPRALRAAASVSGSSGFRGSFMAENVAANMQPRKPQSRRYGLSHSQCYRSVMRVEQQPIAVWIESVLSDKQWTAYRWAKQTRGKVNATTIKRAISPDYEGVTAIRVLRDLADAAAVPMPSLSDGPGDVIVSAAVLREILPVVLALMGLPQPSETDLDQGAALLRSGLQFLSGDPDIAADPTRARLAMRALARGFGGLAS